MPGLTALYLHLLHSVLYHPLHAVIYTLSTVLQSPALLPSVPYTTIFCHLPPTTLCHLHSVILLPSIYPQSSVVHLHSCTLPTPALYHSYTLPLLHSTTPLLHFLSIPPRQTHFPLPPRYYSATPLPLHSTTANPHFPLPPRYHSTTPPLHFLSIPPRQTHFPLPPLYHSATPLPPLPPLLHGKKKGRKKGRRKKKERDRS